MPCFDNEIQYRMTNDILSIGQQSRKRKAKVKSGGMAGMIDTPAYCLLKPARAAAISFARSC